MFNMIKQLFSAKKDINTTTEFKANPKYDNSIYRGTWLIDGNVFVGAYIRDGHPQYYTFVTENGLCYVPRHLQFKQLDRKSMLSLNNEAYIANVIDGHALPVSVLYK